MKEQASKSGLLIGAAFECRQGLLWAPLNHVGRPQVSLVQQGANKNDQVRDPLGRYVGLPFSLEYCPSGVNKNEC